MVPNLMWNSTCFFVNGVPTPLISGEFHYFRVPKKDWRTRLLLLKESGANAVATYIPWIIHEPTEGNILFDDIPERSVNAFLSLCTELGLMVIARPGPHSYSELCCHGLPRWIADNYPEVIAHGPKGFHHPNKKSVSYLHPTFLEKARTFLRAVNRQLRPHLITNGGCIVSIQADNEIGGIHLWRGFLDCNQKGMGIGSEEGHYVRFLRNKYGTVHTLNERYGTAYTAFTQILPFENTPTAGSTGGKRFVTDYQHFYRDMLETYIRILCAWFREDGLDVDYCTNAGTPALVPLMRNIPGQNKENHFLLGVDHYYALFPTAGISMSPEKAVKYLYSLDMLEEMGMPPSVLEMQSGSASCYPPILPENLKGFYMTHVAMGMKGSNYYVFTGGPNFADTGENTDIYDYHAPVSATGDIRPLYYAQKERNVFSLEQAWLLTAKRSCDVQLGFNWDWAESIHSPFQRFEGEGLSLKKYFNSLLLTLGLSARLLKCREIGHDALDTSVPLIAVSDKRMSKKKQQNLIDFVKAGGRLILTPVLPEYDEDFLPCTLLRDFLGVKASRSLSSEGPVILKNGEKVFELQKKYEFPGFGGKALAVNASDGKAIIEYKAVAGGKVLLMGAVYEYSQFCQMDMLELCIKALGGEKRIATDSRELIVTLFEDDDRATCFLLNQLAGALTVDLTVKVKDKEQKLEGITVPAMSVLPIQL